MLQTMPFGKYANLNLYEIPSTYLVHAYEDFNLSDELHVSILKELHKRLFPIHSDIIYGLKDLFTEKNVTKSKVYDLIHDIEHRHNVIFYEKEGGKK